MIPSLPSFPQQSSAPSLPVAIDYPAALALRQMALVQDELPKYLLATLWNTGARINEALALTRGDFSLAPPYPFVHLATLKQRTEKAARTAVRHTVWYRFPITVTSANWK